MVDLRSFYWSIISLVLLVSGCHLFRSAQQDPLQPELVRVEGGAFMMGDLFEYENEDALPVHRVEIETFRLSTYETTYEQYDAFAEATGRPLPEDDGYGRGQRAVVHVTWEDAVAFCAYHGYRLPTEAEWEYAARSGGKKHLYAGTNRIDSLSAYAFYAEHNLDHTMPVGLNKPNDLGLYDMSGNAAEWVGAFYENYPEPGASPTYKDLSKPGIRIIRGGNFEPAANDMLRTYWRAGTLTDISTSSVGFRCAQ